MKILFKDELFAYNLDEKNRIIWLGHTDADGDISIDDQTTLDFIKALHILDQTKGEITVMLNTAGGTDFAMWAIYDAIKLAKNPVKIIAYGRCFSAGVVILQASEKRLLYPNTRLMIHLGDVSDEPKSEIVKLDQKYEDVLYNSIIKKHPKFSRNKLKKMLQIDYYMSSQEAVNLGLADDLIMFKGKK